MLYILLYDGDIMNKEFESELGLDIWRIKSIGDRTRDNHQTIERSIMELYNTLSEENKSKYKTNISNEARIWKEITEELGLKKTNKRFKMVQMQKPTRVTIH